MEYIVYYHEKGEAEYMERILVDRIDTKEQAERVAKEGEEAGYITRVATFKMEMPVFGFNLLNK